MPLSHGVKVSLAAALPFGAQAALYGEVNCMAIDLQTLGHVKNALMPEFVSLAQCANSRQFVVEPSEGGTTLRWVALVNARAFQKGRMQAGFQFTDRSKVMFPVELAATDSAPQSPLFTDPVLRSLLARLAEDADNAELQAAINPVAPVATVTTAPAVVVAPAPAAPVVPEAAAPAVAPAPVPPKPVVRELFEGRFDTVIEGRAEGWLYNHRRPDTRYDIDLLVNDRLVAWGTADLYREDLQQAKKGDGRVKFSIPLPRRVLGGQPKRIVARVHGTQVVLGFHDLVPTGFEVPSVEGLLITPDNYALAAERLGLNHTADRTLLDRLYLCFENGDTVQATRMHTQAADRLRAVAPEFEVLFRAQLELMQQRTAEAIDLVAQAVDANPNSWLLWEAKSAMDLHVHQAASKGLIDEAARQRFLVMNAASDTFRDILQLFRSVQEDLTLLAGKRHG